MVAAGDKIRASDAPGDVRARLRRAANQSFASGTQTALSWDTEDEDTDAFHSTGGTITIPSGLDGIYAIAAYLLWASAPGSGRNLIDIVPSSAISNYPVRFRSSSANTEASLAVAASIPLLGGDTFTIEPFQTSGSPINATGWVSVVRVAVL